MQNKKKAERGKKEVRVGEGGGNSICVKDIFSRGKEKTRTTTHRYFLYCVFFVEEAR